MKTLQGSFYNHKKLIPRPAFLLWVIIVMFLIHSEVTRADMGAPLDLSSFFIEKNFESTPLGEDSCVLSISTIFHFNALLKQARYPIVMHCFFDSGNALPVRSYFQTVANTLQKKITCSSINLSGCIEIREHLAEIFSSLREKSEKTPQCCVKDCAYLLSLTQALTSVGKKSSQEQSFFLIFKNQTLLLPQEITSDSALSLQKSILECVNALESEGSKMYIEGFSQTNDATTSSPHISWWNRVRAAFKQWTLKK